MGMMIAMELAPDIANLPGDPTKTTAARFVNLLHSAGVLAIPTATHIIRFLPPLSLRQSEAAEGLKVIESVAAKVSI
jgi:acetylornithine/succinyldiaminopimelate/putrescine aminotransferase